MSELASIKVGDKLIATRVHCLDEIVIVDRLTSTQITAGNRKFNRRHGRMVGGSDYMTWRVHVPRDGEILEVMQKQLRARILNRIRGFKFDLLTLGTLKEIDSIIQRETHATTPQVSPESRQ